MRHVWALVFAVGACSAQQQGDFGYDAGIGMSSSPGVPLAVGSTHTFLFFDQCTPTREGFCENDHIKSVGSTTVTGPFEVVSTSGGIKIRATGAGSGTMQTTITQTDGEVKTFARNVSALVADRVTASCFPTAIPGPTYVTAGSVLVNRTQGQELYTVHTELFSGAQTLLSDGFYPFTAQGFTFEENRVVAPAAPGSVTMTSSIDAAFAFPFEVVSLAQIDGLELVKVPQQTDTHVGFQIRATVAGNDMCRPPWEAMTLTAGPAGTCSVTQTLRLPAITPVVQWHTLGTCRVEAKITGTSLVATTDLVR